MSLPNKYGRYCETDATALLHSSPTLTAKQVIVIPCFAESPETLTRLLDSIPTKQYTLCILVHNAPETLSAEHITHIRHMQQWLATQPIEWQHPTAPITFRHRHHLSLLEINKTQSPHTIHPTQGVGLARKIGADCAVALMHTGALPYTWIHTTDVDVILPPDYFTQMPPYHQNADIAGCVYPFKHYASTDIAVPMRVYDQWLRHYVNGLTQAGSPYAYHSIGSTIAIHPLAYMAVRGCPKRAAGEDFYLLNKLAKQGRIQTLTGNPLHIEGRLTQRTPFGTAAALNTWQHFTDWDKEPPWYPPDSFIALQQWLDIIHEITLSDTEESIQETINTTHCAAEETLHFLKTQQFFSILMKLQKHHPTQPALTQALHHWFDAFKTLKYIHHITPLFTKKTSSAPSSTVPH